LDDEFELELEGGGGHPTSSTMLSVKLIVENVMFKGGFTKFTGKHTLGAKVRF